MEPHFCANDLMMFKKYLNEANYYNEMDTKINTWGYPGKKCN